MAKMIYVIRTGKDNADSYKSVATSFTDVNGTWAEGFIKYCQSMGIIAGKNAKTFAPNALVTGTEAAKMLLVTAGYKADKAGLVGGSWATKTLGLAEENGLLDDVDAPMGAGLPRQYAAQIISNGIDMDTVKYDGDEVVKTETTKTKYESVAVKDNDGKTVGYSVVPTTVRENETVGEKYLDLQTSDDITMNTVTYDDAKKTYTVNDTFKKIDKDYSFLMGQKIKVLHKKDDTSKVYGVYADPDSEVLATGSVGALDTVTNETKQFKLNGVVYKFDNTAASQVATMFNKTNEGTTLGALESDKAAKSAWSIKFIDNSDSGKVDTVVVTPTEVGKVTYVGKTSITAGNKSYKFDDDSIYDGVKKDDYAVIVKGDYTVTGDATLTKAETLSGKVTGTKSGEVQVDGKWYKLAKGVTGVDTGSSYDFAVVGSYIYSADETTASSKDILYISGNKLASDDLNNEFTAEARAYFMDGTNAKIKVNKLYDEGTKKYDKITTSNAAANALIGLYTYGKNSDGNYQIRKVSDKNDAGYDSFSSENLKNDKTTKLGGKYAFADDAVVFVKATTEVKVLSGKTVKNWSDATVTTNGASLLKESNGIDYVMVSALTVSSSEVPGADGDKLYGYLTTDSYKGEDEKGDDAAVLKVWDGSSDLTVFAESSLDYDNFKAGTAIEFSYKDGKNINTPVALKSAAIKGFDGKAKGEMSLLSNEATLKGTLTLDADCVFIGIDDKNTKGTDGSIDDVRLAMSEKKGYLTENAYIALNTAGDKILAVIYDTEEGKLDKGAELANEKTYAVTASATVDGDTAAYDETVTVNPTSVLAVEGEAVEVTITVPAKADVDSKATASIGIAVTGTGASVSTKKIDLTNDDLKNGTTKTFTITTGSAATEATATLTVAANTAP